MQDAENANEWINWIEEAIDKEYFKYYEYNNFKNIQKIGSGGFGVVYRANWKNSEQCLALKSFSKLDYITAKEIVQEVIRISSEFNLHYYLFHSNNSSCKLLFSLNFNGL